MKCGRVRSLKPYLSAAGRRQMSRVCKQSLQFRTSQSQPDAGTFHVLLTHTGHNLGNVQWRPQTIDRSH